MDDEAEGGKDSSSSMNRKSIAVRTIHPFPARMAPEIALRECGKLPRGSLILDPMAGSGTVLRYASEHGHHAVGYDMDPLAVLLSQVWTTPIDTKLLRSRATNITENARGFVRSGVVLPWIDQDTGTKNFIAYWFGLKQRLHLRALASELVGMGGATGNALRLALSRLIITKEPKASLARDTSHSRPHRVIDKSDLDVIGAFEKSVDWLARQLEKQTPPSNCRVQVGDARALRRVENDSVDAVITSPPYLNAIDYMRAHRLSLVWFGHRVDSLRTTRSNLVGAERGPDNETPANIAELVRSIEPPVRFSPRLKRIAERYANDMFRVVSEIERVLKPGAPATLVIGNSTVEGSFVENAQLIKKGAEMAGLKVTGREERELPPARRYLPPPMLSNSSALDARMRTEVILKLRKPAA